MQCPESTNPQILTSLETFKVTLDERLSEEMLSSKLNSLAELNIETSSMCFIKVLNGISAGVKQGLLPGLTQLNVALLKSEQDLDLLNEKELFALVEELDSSKIDFDIINNVVMSTLNVLIHITTNFDTNEILREELTDLPVHSKIQSTFDNLVESID